MAVGEVIIGACASGRIDPITVNGPDISAFIRSTFRSIWSLEMLLMMTREQERRWSPGELVTALRASDLVVSRALEDLDAAGLIAAEVGGQLRYAPASPRLRALVAGTSDFYQRSPDAARRLILDQRQGGPTVFADAFRFRKD